LDAAHGGGFKPCPAKAKRRYRLRSEACRPKGRRFAAYISGPPLPLRLEFTANSIGAFRFTLFFISHFFLLYT
jgi:hypothetical protein